MCEVIIIIGKISVKDTHDVLIYKVEGDLDNLTSIKYKKLVNESVSNKRGKVVVFDLSNTTFIDSSGIGVILSTYHIVSDYKGKFAICGLNNNIKKTIMISGIPSLINVYDDIYENISECVVNSI